MNILPALSKVVEKCVKDQLVPFLETNKILPTMQSGFRKKHSTTSALLNITDDILAASSQGKGTILVLLDFSRAFDCVDIPTLLTKLASCGIGAAACAWFRSYFQGRCQRVQCLDIDNKLTKSAQLPLERGVI